MKTETKIQTLLYIFVGILFLVFLRAAYWQIVEGEQLAIEADKQHFYSLEVPANRGIISSRDGLTLVADRQSYTLYANLTQLKNPAGEISAQLAPVLLDSNPQIATTSSEQDEFKNTLTNKLALPQVVWVKLFTGLSVNTKEKIDNLKFPGLSFVSEPARDYPEASMAAQLLGFVGEDSQGGKKGYFGVEGYYNKDLEGKSGWIREEKDAFQRPILLGSTTSQEKIDGSDLELTLDSGVQVFVEKFLREGITTWGAASGTAVVMDPRTGEILADASFPNYDPANSSLYPSSVFKDPLIADLFEPGSILKPLVMAAAVNEGRVTPQTQCDDCSGPAQVGTYSIHTFNNVYHPHTTMLETLINSDNTGMVFVGKTLGFDQLYKYINSYGFSKKTGIDLEGEGTGTLRPINEWYPIDQATITFGQGIAVTPIQIVTAFSAIANGGKLPAPHVVRAVTSQGQRRNLTFPPQKQVFSDHTAQTITQMLTVVNLQSELHFPLDRMPNLKKFKIAAKSGTAQIPIAGHYEEGKTTGSVIGFAPADNPRFIVLVKLDAPSVRQWGSDTAGPIFYSIINGLFNYYGVNPTE